MDQASALNLTDQLTFVWPWVFVLLPLPWLVRYLLPPSAPQCVQLRVPLLLQPAPEAIPHVRLPQRRRRLAYWIWLLLVIACAHPQWAGNPVAVPNQGHDLMLAVDISGSMQQNDMQLDGQPADRLSAVKKIVSDFAQRREGDRLGLIVFGTQAYLHVPLTYDRATVSAQLQGIQLRMAGEQTAIGDAIGLAIKRLKDQPKNARILIILTDGTNTAGTLDPYQAAVLAAGQQLKIYTIGIGADQMAVPTLLGTQRLINPSQDLDEGSLLAIARQTGGRYFRARNTQELEAIYQTLDQLEPVIQDARLFRPYQSLLHWPLLLGFISLLSVAAYRSFRTSGQPIPSAPEE